MTDMSQEQRQSGQFQGEDQHGWSPDVGSERSEAAEGVDKAFDAEQSEGPGRQRDLAEHEQAGVPATDTEATSPKGVGDSEGRNAEDIAKHEQEPGRYDEGTKGPSQRPYGKSTGEDSTGVATPEPVDPKTSDLQTGDQGG